MQVAKFPAHSRPQPSLANVINAPTVFINRYCVTWTNVLFMGASVCLPIHPTSQSQESLAVARVVFQNCNVTHQSLRKMYRNHALCLSMAAIFTFWTISILPILQVRVNSTESIPLCALMSFLSLILFSHAQCISSPGCRCLPGTQQHANL